MKILKSVAELQCELSSHSNVGFVPTMGALHAGHISLVERAKQYCDTIVVSLFVNPTQFNDKGDLERYPRTLEADAEMLAKAGAHILFAPSVDEVYPEGTESDTQYTELLPLMNVMEGKCRAGHFEGVVQVVSRLFDIVKPQSAFFGEKDFQQLAIIRKMCEVQGRDIQIVGCEIVRAEDGLALSSRNMLLNSEERAVAPQIYKVLHSLRSKIEAGAKNYRELEANALLDINKNLYLCAEYVEVVDAYSLQSAETETINVRVCAAVKCGNSVRLIDNI